MKFRAGLAGLVMLTSQTAMAGTEQATFVEDLAARLVPAKVSAALVAMPDESRKLLALRSYLRSAAILEDRWSWTEAEIAAFQGTEEQRALQAEIDAVNAHFAETNPGYELYVHSQVRSLETQIEHWNENESVGASSSELWKAWRESDLMPIDPTDADALARFRSWLRSFKPTERAHIAAPGLSRHGRAQAIDFQVKKDGDIIAGTNWGEIETVWGDGGWEARLKASITAAGPSFSGPLTSPHEPWHYDYASESESNAKIERASRLGGGSMESTAKCGAVELRG